MWLQKVVEQKDNESIIVLQYNDYVFAPLKGISVSAQSGMINQNKYLQRIVKIHGNLQKKNTSNLALSLVHFVSPILLC